MRALRPLLVAAASLVSVGCMEDGASSAGPELSPRGADAAARSGDELAPSPEPADSPATPGSEQPAPAAATPGDPFPQPAEQAMIDGVGTERQDQALPGPELDTLDGGTPGAMDGSMPPKSDAASPPGVRPVEDDGAVSAGEGVAGDASVDGRPALLDAASHEGGKDGALDAALNQDTGLGSGTEQGAPDDEPSAGADSGVVDAGLELTPCEQACGEAGGVCVGDTRCDFDCTAEGACVFEIECPDEFDCRVDCSGEESCSETVRCPEEGADLCEVFCGEDACQDGVVCGGVECAVSCGPGGCASSAGNAIRGGATRYDISCSGDGSCFGGIACNAQICELECTGAGSCRGGAISMSANSATLECEGAGSCDEEIYCNSASCDIDCNTGAGACATHCSGGCN